MIYVTYGKMSREGLNGLTAKPENQAEALGKMVDSLGGKLIDYYFLLMVRSISLSSVSFLMIRM